MDNYFVLSDPTGLDCIDLDQSYLEICLKKTDCNPSDPGGFLVDIGDQWNCNLCQTDRQFFLPVLEGDVFMFQTRFYDGVNEDPENPTLGLTDWLHLEVLDADGNAVMNETEAGLVLRSLVAHSGKSSYQLYEIDFDVIVETCFSIRFFTDDNQQVVTNHYTREPKACQSTVLIRSVQRGRDNAGNYYGAPIGLYVGDLMTFNNQARIPAGVHTDTYSVEKTIVGRTRVSSVITEDVSMLTFNELVPPFIVKWMTRVILSGEIIIVDGIEYTIDSYTKTRDNRAMKMYFLEIPLTEKKVNQTFEC